VSTFVVHFEGQALGFGRYIRGRGDAYGFRMRPPQPRVVRSNRREISVPLAARFTGRAGDPHDPNRLSLGYPAPRLKPWRGSESTPPATPASAISPRRARHSSRATKSRRWPPGMPRKSTTSCASRSSRTWRAASSGIAGRFRHRPGRRRSPGGARPQPHAQRRRRAISRAHDFARRGDADRRETCFRDGRPDADRRGEGSLPADGACGGPSAIHVLPEGVSRLESS